MDKTTEDLRHIRSMMERSTKFLSLSGLSGVTAGLTALVGAYIAHLMITGEISLFGNLLFDLVCLAGIILLVSSSFGLYFSIRKAKKQHARFWMPATMQILADFSIPLITGGLLCIILIYNQTALYIAPIMLIFYGLSLIYAGARTYKDIKILGFCEIALGLLAAIFTHNGLLFWALGFGVLHIIYGIVIYWKHDRNNKTTEI